MKYQSAAEILLLPVFEHKRPPCWNSAYGFDFNLIVVIGMSFCIGFYARQSCDVISLFQMAAGSHVDIV